MIMAERNRPPRPTRDVSPRPERSPPKSGYVRDLSTRKAYDSRTDPGALCSAMKKQLGKRGR